METEKLEEGVQELQELQNPGHLTSNFSATARLAERTLLLESSRAPVFGLLL